MGEWARGRWNRNSREAEIQNSPAMAGRSPSPHFSPILRGGTEFGGKMFL